MPRPLRPALVAALAALAPLGLAACGGGAKQAATTTGATTAAATAATTSGTALAERLPPADAVPGLDAGKPIPRTTAQQWVLALANEGDPSNGETIRRYEDAGFQGGVIRDQRRATARPVLFRSFVARLGSAQAARAEAARAVAGVARSGGKSAQDVTVPGVPGARATNIVVPAAGQRIGVLFVSYGAGPYLYGYQVISLVGGRSLRPAVLAAARGVYDRWGAVP